MQMALNLDYFATDCHRQAELATSKLQLPIASSIQRHLLPRFHRPLTLSGLLTLTDSKISTHLQLHQLVKRLLPYPHQSHVMQTMPTCLPQVRIIPATTDCQHLGDYASTIWVLDASYACNCSRCLSLSSGPTLLSCLTCILDHRCCRATPVFYKR